MRNSDLFFNHKSMSVESYLAGVLGGTDGEGADEGSNLLKKQGSKISNQQLLITLQAKVTLKIINEEETGFQKRLFYPQILKIHPCHCCDHYMILLIT